MQGTEYSDIIRAGQELFRGTQPIDLHELPKLLRQPDVPRVGALYHALLVSGYFPYFTGPVLKADHSYEVIEIIGEARSWKADSILTDLNEREGISLDGMYFSIINAEPQSPVVKARFILVPERKLFTGRPANINLMLTDCL